MDIELVVFDLAGTTVKDNKDVHKVLKKAMAKHAVEISLEEANAIMGMPKPIAIRLLLEKRYPGATSITEEWIGAIHKDFVKEMIEFYQSDISVGEIDGVSDLFRKLKANGIKIAVDTGFDRAITKPLLERLGWIRNSLIDVSVTSDEVEHGRPHPDLIYKAMELAGVKDVKKVAKVGDTIFDLGEGTAAQCGLVIGVTSGSFSRQELEKESHTHLVDTVHGLLDLLGIK